MVQHFIGAATFSFECGVSSHDFPNFVLCAAELRRVLGRQRRSPSRRDHLRAQTVLEDRHALDAPGLFAERRDEEFSYRFKASLANFGGRTMRVANDAVGSDRLNPVSPHGLKLFLR